ncbi:MAG: hypothetical protein C5S48_02630 [Candidatus Methanogaster sp.]|nr:MAG: hypothetical protein C5S48_02630 [ANME-2 cluster archaeon]
MTCTALRDVVADRALVMRVIKDEQPARIVLKPAFHSPDDLCLVCGVFLWQIQTGGKTGIIGSHRRRLLRVDPPDDPVIRLMAVDVLHRKLGLANTTHAECSLFPRGTLS